MFPPHIPPPSVSIAHHQMWFRFKIFATVLIASLLSGLVGAAIMLGWIWPVGLVFTNQGGVVTLLNRSGLNELAPEVTAAVNQEVLTIYQKLGTDGLTRFLNPADKIGEAMILTSDGWAVFPAKDFNVSAARGWQLLSSSGQLFIITQSVYDGRAGLTYVKITRPASATTTALEFTEARSVTFAPRLESISQVYVLVKGVWQSAVLRSGSAGLGVIPHLDNEPAVGYALDGVFPTGASVVDGGGRLVGFIKKDNIVLPGVIIDRLLPQVLSKGKVAYPSLGVQGWFDDEQPIIVGGQRQSGFAISKVLTPGGALRRGDVITMLNGEAVRPDMWWGALENAKNVSVSVLRSGKVIELTVPVMEL